MFRAPALLTSPASSIPVVLTLHLPFLQEIMVCLQVAFPEPAAASFNIGVEQEKDDH
jgi:hypothetical protein